MTDGIKERLQVGSTDPRIVLLKLAQMGKATDDHRRREVAKRENKRYEEDCSVPTFYVKMVDEAGTSYHLPASMIHGHYGFNERHYGHLPKGSLVLDVKVYDPEGK